VERSRDPPRVELDQLGPHWVRCWQRAYGTVRQIQLILEQIVKADEPQKGIPLYLRPSDPMCAPIASHNAATNNLLIKVTVPKRTGRKRKRGSQDVFQDGSHDPAHSQNGNVRIHPTELLQMLKDNSERYSIDVVGKINHTQRFRGILAYLSAHFQPDIVPFRPCRLPTIYQPD
jgi:hypothetical protein